jgi:hypothetical protein
MSLQGVKSSCDSCGQQDSQGSKSLANSCDYSSLITTIPCHILLYLHLKLLVGIDSMLPLQVGNDAAGMHPSLPH